jgi:hypothetical protein
MPAMDKLHYTDLQKKAAFARIYKGKTGPSEVEMMDTQAELFKQHAANIEAAGGEEAAAKVRAADPMKAMGDIATALGNAVTALTGDSMRQFAAAAEDFAKAVEGIVPNLKAFASDHPTDVVAGIGAAATAGGYAAWRATQGILGGIGNVLRGGAVAEVAGASGGGLLRRAIPGALMLEGAGIGASSAWQSPGHAFGGSGWEAAKRLWSGEDRKSSSLPMFASGAVPGAPVTAQLNGQAQITVSLDASPALIALLQTSVSTNASGDVSANTGVSMPEASPSQGGRNGVSQ